VVKTLALVSFIHYAMSADNGASFRRVSRHRRQARLSAYVAHAIKWTFWPSLAATILLLALGKPLLWLFGPQFVTGYDIMFIAAIGLVCAPRSAGRAAAQHARHQHICALAYALAFVMNVVLCVALVPRFGGHAPRRRPRSRWCSKPCCCSGLCGDGSACTCWRSGSVVESLHVMPGLDPGIHHLRKALSV